MSSNTKRVVFCVVLAGLAVFLFAFLKRGQPNKELQIPVSEFVNRVQAGQIKEVTIAGNDARGAFHTQIPTNFAELYKMLTAKGVKHEYKESNGSGWFFLARQLQSGDNQVLSFGKSRAADRATTVRECFHVVRDSLCPASTC